LLLFKYNGLHDDVGKLLEKYLFNISSLVLGFKESNNALSSSVILYPIKELVLVEKSTPVNGNINSFFWPGCMVKIISFISGCVL